MVKTVVGDEVQLKLAEDRLSGSAIPSQVGLVIGKLSSKFDKGFVYELVPTPPNDAGDPPCSLIEGIVEHDISKKKNPSKSKSQLDSSSLCIDVDWISEHARLVSRMLLGGMKVVGIYVWVHETLFKNSTVTLCQALKGIAAATSSTINDSNERLLIHIGYSPLRWSCRFCLRADSANSSTLWPCDFKMGKVLGSLQTFRCTYNFDVRLPVLLEDRVDTKRFTDVLRDGIVIHAKELTDANVLINGKLVVDEEQCASENFNEVEFLLPLLQDKYVDGNQKEVLGMILFSGSVCCLSYLNLKEPISQGLVDIKDDIIRSLQSRLDMLCDEADTELETATNGVHETDNHTLPEKPVPFLDLPEQRKQCSLPFPRRVFVPWLEGTYICDYIQPSESIEVLKDHCVELMSMEFPTDASEILEPECNFPVAASSTTDSFWDVVSGCSSSVKPDNLNSREATKKESVNSADLNTVKVALLILIASIIIGLLLNAVRVA